jgi:endoglucanase
VPVSRHVPVFSSSNASQPATNANDDDYGTEWRSVLTPAWLAYDLSSVPVAKRHQALVVYYNNSYGYTTRYGPHYNNAGAYTVETNAAPGGGQPPSSGWTVRASVTGNTFHSRQITADLGGDPWFRVVFTASDGASQNMDVSLNQLDVYDVSSTPDRLGDDLIFYGDSITAGGMSPFPSSGVGSLPELIHASQPSRWPVQENGGDPYETSGGAVSALLGASGFLSIFRGTYVGLSYGMNDAGSACCPDQYYANLRQLIDAIIAQGRIPMLPKIGWTHDPNHNANIPAYNAKVDQLWSEYPQVVRGPDFWAYFQAHPDQVGAGDIHPNAAGYAAMRQQWAQTLLDSVYAGTPATFPAGLHANANRILDGSDKAVRLIGVNHSGTEYACVGGGTQDASGYAIWEPTDFGTRAAYLTAVKSWHANTVRVGLNEACWLGLDGVNPTYTGAAYRRSIADFVTMATSAGLAVILELHWSSPGNGSQFVPHGQAPMPDRDHTPALWRDLADTFKGNSAVVFDLFNEPYPHWNQDADDAWVCWRDGSDPADPGNTNRCVGSEWWDLNGNAFNGGRGYVYPVAGMQELVDAVRGTGARNLILVGGVQYANNLRRWTEWRPSDPAGNLAASWHDYPFNVCAAASCWDAQVAPVAASVPLVAGEIGEGDCASGFVGPLMTWLDQHSASYLAWVWNAWGCSGMQLMADYLTGSPTGYGQGVHDHFLSL